MTASRFVLGSRSPRRRELLALVVPSERIDILPPRDHREAGFAGLHDEAAIEHRLREIARTKCIDVLEQLRQRSGSEAGQEVAAVISADTIIVVDDGGVPRVLGQPPEDETWSAVVRKWFVDYYAGRAHRALTGLCVGRLDGTIVERIVSTKVTFSSDVLSRLDWYLSTGEPRGKAGGYAIQGAGSVFISRVEGSLSNVVGLPLESLLEVFEELRFDFSRHGHAFPPPLP